MTTSGAAVLRSSEPRFPAPVPRDAWLGRIFVIFWIAALTLAAVQAWTSRFEMAPDGIQYLDNADAYFNGNWRDAANTQWSPMYPWLLGAAMRVLKPSPYWEFPVLHLVNFFVFVAALIAFQYFLSTLLARSWIPRPVEARAIAAVACGAFLYAMLDFTNVINPTPDLTMAVFVFLTAALLARIMTGDRAWHVFVLFGIALGLGYIAKAPFFVYAFACIAILIFLALLKRLTVARAAVAFVAFALTAGPYIAFLSHEKGRITYGDSGKYNLAWMVNGVPYYNWQGGPDGAGTPLHPTRKLSDNPPVYEFASPIAGTYPPWYDPIYWNQGVKVRYRPADFLHAIERDARVYLFIAHHRQTPLLCGLVIFLLLGAGVRIFLREAGRLWPLLAFAVFPFLMYAPVHVDARFLGPFFVLLWTALFAAAILSLRSVPPRVIYAIAGTVACMMLIEGALVSGPTHPIEGLQDQATGRLSQNPSWDIAAALKADGIHAGEQGAIVGSELPYFWARLARVRIVAEALPRSLPYDGQARQELAAEWERAKAVLETTPAKFVISPAIPGIVDQPGWERLGGTDAFVYKFGARGTLRPRAL